MMSLFKIFGLLGLFVLSWTVFADVHLTQRESGTLALEWSTDGVKVEASTTPEIFGAPTLSELSVEDLPLSQTPFHPSLPYKSFIVEGDAKKIQVYMQHEQLGLLRGVTPAPAAQWPCRCEGEAPQWEFRKSVYENPKVKSWVKVSALGDYKGTPLSRVTFYPTRVKGLETVEFLKSATVEIHGAKIWNFNQLGQKSRTRQRLLIVSPEKFRAAMQVFADAKTSAGFDVEWIGYKNQTPDKLRKQIHDLYSQNPFDFAVIAGAHSEVPGHLVSTSADPQTPTDNLYFSIGGRGDYIPDVFYSRLVAQDSESLRRLVTKVLESNRADPFPLQNEAMGLASDEGFNPTDEEYIQDMLSPLERGLGWRAKYYLQRRRSDGPDAILEGFANGAHWLNYIGHGVGPAWTSIAGREFNLEDIKKIPSHEALPVVVDVACQNGRLTHDGRLGVHLMNHFDQGFAAGAKAYYGGNVDISWHPPAVMAVGIAEARASGDFEHLGEVLWAGQVHLLQTYEDLPAALENLTWYHLQGDPSLSLPH